MKNPLGYLTELQQRDLKRLALIIRRKIKDVALILFIDRNETVTGRLGVKPAMASSLDNVEIVVISHHSIRERRVDLYRKINYRLLQVTESFVPSCLPLYLDIPVKNLDADTLFYWETCRYGIPLYDSGEIQLLHQKRSPDYRRIYDNVLSYRKAHSRIAGEFVWGAEQYYGRKSYAMTAYMLAQAAETYMRIMVYSYKEYDFRFKYPEEWLKCCCRLVPELLDIFPDRGGDDDRLYALLNVAPRKALYDSEFAVTKEDAEMMLLTIWELGDLSGKVCGKMLKKYKAEISA